MLAIGMFDGLHRGHMRVLRAAAKIAKAENARMCVLTFTPHPSTVINMGVPPAKMLCSPRIRAEMFAEAGAKKVFVKKFDKRFASMRAEAFANYLGKKYPNLRGIATGKNFVFGRGAEGDFKTLKKLAREHGWQYTAVNGLRLKDGRRISSTLMRGALERGDLEFLKKISARDYVCDGLSVRGKQLGRKMGFATINLPWNPQCKPPFGAYAVRFTLGKSGKWLKGVANYGVCPTVSGGQKIPTLEIHSFAPLTVRANTHVRARLIKFLRAERKFPSIEALARQIAKDVQEAKNILK